MNRFWKYILRKDKEEDYIYVPYHPDSMEICTDLDDLEPPKRHKHDKKNIEPLIAWVMILFVVAVCLTFHLVEFGISA